MSGHPAVDELRSLIRPMEQVDEVDVRRLYKICHPRWPAKPPHWYHAHATQVLEVQGQVVGFTAYSVGPPPSAITMAEPELMFGHGVYVHPDYRRKGYGRQLADERLSICRELRLRTFVGMTQPHNAAMRAIFDAQGLKQYGEAPKAYPDGATALIYLGAC